MVILTAYQQHMIIAVCIFYSVAIMSLAGFVLYQIKKS